MLESKEIQILSLLGFSFPQLLVGHLILAVVHVGYYNCKNIRRSWMCDLW